MSKSLKPELFGESLARELTLYQKSVTERVNECGRTAIKTLVQKTKGTAPVGARGSFKKNIASKEIDAGHGMKSFIWYVKSPDHRLTHLLVHGHATKNGGRTKGDPFLSDALDQVLPEYEKDVEEAVK